MKPLSEKKKREIRIAIQAYMEHGDEHPDEIITKKYGGDEEEYLKDMAAWHGIKI